MLRRRRKRRYRKKITFIQRFFRSVIAIIILSAFILGISLMVKEMAGLDPYGVVKLASPILEKIGISTDKAGEVAGTFAERLLKTNIAPSESYKEDLGGKVGINNGSDGSGASETDGGSTSRLVVFKVAMMGDSANDNMALGRALGLAKSLSVNRIFYLGDYTEVGELTNLQAAKSVMDEGGLVYYSLPGDHDLDINSDPADFGNYYTVFGEPRTSVTINDSDIGPLKFVLLNNAANFTPIDSETLGQFYQELDGADYVILSQPLYHPLASLGKPVMGNVDGNPVPEMLSQAEDILEKIRESNVKAIIAGDQHSFGTNKDAKKDNLEHIYIGAINGGSLGVDSIVLLTIYDDDSYSVEQIKLD